MNAQGAPRRAAMLVVILMMLLPALGFADERRSYSSVVVQNRQYDPTHEFGVGLGLLPLDAFTKGVALSGSYTLHFNEAVAWEVGQFVYSLQYDTDLKQDLGAFDLRPTPFEALDYYVSSSVVLKPLYWKGAFFNSSLLHGEMLLSLGGAYGWFTRSTRPGVTVGGAVRLWGTELVSVRLDARYLMFFNDAVLENFETKDELWVSIGTALTF